MENIKGFLKNDAISPSLRATSFLQLLLDKNIALDPTTYETGSTGSREV
jgi:hypothetical protein